METPFSIAVTPDWEGFLRCIKREGRPQRVHHIELFLDGEIQDAICARYGVGAELDRSDPNYALQRQMELNAFLGYDFVRCSADVVALPLHYIATQDTAAIPRAGGRSYIDEHKGPITSWEDFERYPWPDLDTLTTHALEWYARNLREGMCIVAGGGFGHFAEHITWLMGYETLCFALCEQRDLVTAITERLVERDSRVLDLVLQFDCVKAVWGSDDMGFRGGPLIAPDDLREFVFPGHALMAQKAHAAGRPYLLHSCGNLECVMDDLINDVKIDAKHSFEDTIELVTNSKRKYGDRIALLGGVDVDFLCRATGKEVRRRVRETLDVCMSGGGYCLGTGNSVTNYIPLDNYLAMLDEGRKFGRS